MQTQHELDQRVKELEDKLTRMVGWLEKNQPDVFRRGLWDALDEPPDKTEYDWMVWSDDVDRAPELFGGTEAHAMKVLEYCGQNWTCHLYKRVASA